jgi:hypothetical protein
MSTLLTDEQLDQIAQVFNLNRKATIKVRDGFIAPDDMVWWWSENRPEKVIASRHLENIKEFPNVYSIKEPRTKIIYLDEGAE